MKIFLYTSIVILSIIAISCILHHAPPEQIPQKPNVENTIEKNKEELTATIAVANCDHYLINQQEQQERIISLESELARKNDEVAYLQDSLTAQQNIWKTAWPKRKGRTVVLYLSIPGSGEDVIRSCITRVTGAPTFSLYTDDIVVMEEEVKLDVSAIPMWKSCDGGSDCAHYDDFPVLIKSYLPVVTKQSNVPTFQKAIRIIRNPLDSIRSFFEVCATTSWLASRRRSWDNHVRKETSEYKKFHEYWDRYQVDTDISFLTIRYEDLCADPLTTFLHIFAFLDILHYYDESSLNAYISTYDFFSVCTSPLTISHDKYTAQQVFDIEDELQNVIEKYNYEDTFRRVILKD